MENEKTVVSILYGYKEGSTFWVVYGEEGDLMGPMEKPFNTKEEAKKFMSQFELIMDVINQ